MIICPYCNVAFTTYVDTHLFTGKSVDDNEDRKKAYLVEGIYCPECGNFILYLKAGSAEYVEYRDDYDDGRWELIQIDKQEMLCPKEYDFELSEDVPDSYKDDYREALSVLKASPKASAALSRRILQRLLKDEYQINKYNLVDQITAFINKEDIPEYLANSVDAIRIIGNFAAHSQKSKNTGEIIEVEKGEAEWTLEVLKELFHHKFIQPRRLEQRIKSLNEKLGELGKGPMKQRLENMNENMAE